MAVNLTGLDLTGSAIGASRNTPASPAPPVAAKDDGAPQHGNVNITSTAALLAHVEQSLGRLPAVDQKRVDSISASLAAGTYKVDPDKVAGGLIQSERSLGRIPLSEI